MVDCLGCSVLFHSVLSILPYKSVPVLSKRQCCIPTLFTAITEVVRLLDITFLFHLRKGASRVSCTVFVGLL